ncbi:hypothetical protein THRCLA_03605 [Thraustotheca clavata]|uniref:Uncharacterized protein n=1 Tax=Thraustotheca clavata TaxID=74557 RepID=A0A1W0A1J7_9STRA|nr:hypothetical protein THRCLA_03605 [Thraustotheca clavata]
MEKRKQLLDDLDAAFATKKPKLMHKPPGVIASKQKPMNTNAKKPKVGISKEGNDNKTTKKVNSKYAPLSNEVQIRQETDLPRQNIKLLQQQLMAMSLKKHGNEDYIEKLRGKALQLQNPHKTNAKTNQSIQAIQFPKRMSKKQSKAAGFESAPPTISYEIALELNKLWMQYMVDLIGDKNLSSSNVAFETCPFGNKLLKADYQGCLLKGIIFVMKMNSNLDLVVRSNNPSWIGMTGIVLLEHANTFQLVTPKDKLVLLPKICTSFAFDINQMHFRFEGTSFLKR